MSHLVEYIAAALLNSANHSGNSKARLSNFVREDYEVYRGSIGKIVEGLKSQFGPYITSEDVEQALELLEKFAAANREFSPATNAFWTIKFDNFRYYFIEDTADPADDAELYGALRQDAESMPVLMAYGRNGSVYIEDALEHFAQMSETDLAKLREPTASSFAASASDRVVSLTHNQQTELDEAATELINVVERENQIDGDASLRQGILGQLKAGRELIRAGVLNAHLLQQTLLSLLGGLIEKYKGQAIGETAKQLLALLIKHIFTGS